MNWETVGAIASAIIIVAGTVVMILRAMKEGKAKKAGLTGNPARCIEHSNRILALEDGRVAIFRSIAEMSGKVDIIKTDVERLLELHLKP